MAECNSALGAARADFCRFLAACYYEPGQEFAEEHLLDSMLAAAGQVDAELAAGTRRLAEAFAAEPLDSLLVEYTRVFLGPIGAPARPYGSLWFGDEKRLMQDSTAAVLELYGEGGFDLAEDFHDLPDHIAAELEFLYQLLFREARARGSNDIDLLDSASSLRTRLIGEHLGRWVVPFASALKAASRSPFYRELADVTKRFITIESTWKGA